MTESGLRFDGRFARVQGAIGWGALLLCLLAVIPQGGNLPVVWILLAMAVLPLFAAQLFLSAVRPTAGALRRAWLVLALYLAVLLWGIVQTEVPVTGALAHPVWSLLPEPGAGRISADPEQGRHILLRLATYGMVAWILAASALNSQRAWRYVMAIALFSSALAVFGIAAAVTGVNVVLGLDGAPTVVSATFVNRNSYATYAAFGLYANVAVYVMLAGRGASEDRRASLRNFLENFFRAAWLFALGALLCGAAIVMTASRAGAGASALGLIVLMIAMTRRRRAANLMLWGIVALIAIFVASALSTTLIGRLMFLVDTGEDARFLVFPVLLAQIADRPWLGQGIGAFQDAFRPHVPLEVANFEWDMAHSSYLENLYELGVPAAVVLYLALALVVARLLAGLRRRESDAGLPALALAVLTAAGVHATVDFSLQMPACTALFAVILGLGWSQSFRRPDRAALAEVDG